ncbi:MAG: uroporphyrinogen decarboxylase family protein [Victivallales bacterium]
MKNNNLTGIERVRAVVTGKDYDRPPVAPMMMLFAGKYSGIPFGDYCRDGEKMAGAQLKTMRGIGTDILLTCSDPAREVVDIAGGESVRWFDDQPPAIIEEIAALSDKSRLRTFRKPNPSKRGRMNDRVKAIEILVHEAKGEAEIVGWVEGALALAAELRGINNIMYDFIDDPDFVDELLDFTAEVAIDYAKIQADAGADTIGMSDAAACMIGPELYEKHVFPRQMRILSAIRSYGVMTRCHMCGCTDPLLPMMKTLPVDIYEIDFKTDAATARKALGPDRVLCGNISTVGPLLYGRPEDVIAEAGECYSILGRRSMVSPGCEVSQISPVANVRAMVDFSKKKERQ